MLSMYIRGVKINSVALFVWICALLSSCSVVKNKDRNEYAALPSVSTGRELAKGAKDAFVETVNQREGEEDGSAVGHWVKKVALSKSIEVEGAQDGERYVYRSPNYEFVSDAKLEKEVSSYIGELFETTRLYVLALPYEDLKRPYQGSRHKVLLLEKDESYTKAGGPAGSSAVYLGGRDVILTKFSSLGLTKFENVWKLGNKSSLKGVLSHEVVHQLIDKSCYVRCCHGWFTEGLAEYVSATPYRRGKFELEKAPKAVKQYATTYSQYDLRGRAIGKEVKLVH